MAVMTSPAAGLTRDAEADPDDIDAEALAKGLIHRQLRALDRLTEIGMHLAEAVDREVTAPKAEDGPAPDLAQLAVAFDRASRAVRTAFLVQSRLIAELRKLGSGDGDPTQVIIRDLRAEARAEPEVQAQRRASDVSNAVRRVALAERGSGEEAERLARIARDRVEVDDIDGDIRDRPVSELLARICRDLGLSPDWSVLADEGWAGEEIATGDIGEPLAAHLKAASAASWSPAPVDNPADSEGDVPPGRASKPP